MKNFPGAQLCPFITSDASSQPLTTKTIGWGLFSWKKMGSCKWKHRTEWGCLKIIEKTMKTISPAEGWLAVWEKTRQMILQDTRKCWAFSGLWQPRMNTGSLLYAQPRAKNPHLQSGSNYVYEYNGLAPDKANHPNTVSSEAEGDLGREKGAKIRRDCAEKQT